MSSVGVAAGLADATWTLQGLAWAPSGQEVWFTAADTLPLFRNVPEGLPRPGSTGWRELLETLRHIRERRAVWMFLLAYWLYIDGVDTIIVMAVDFGMKLGFPSASLIVARLMGQFFGCPAAIVFGYRLTSSW